MYSSNTKYLSLVTWASGHVAELPPLVMGIVPIMEISTQSIKVIEVSQMKAVTVVHLKSGNRSELCGFVCVYTCEMVDMYFQDIYNGS